MIDTHAHIFLEHFDEDISDVIKQAVESGVEKILLPNIDSTTTDSLLKTVEQFPDKVYPMMGLHPCSVNENYTEELEHVERHLDSGDFLAVGEIGTDLYWDKTFWKEQQQAFNVQCELALSNDLPVVIHCRKTIDETIALAKPWASKGLKGVFHCFTGNAQQGQEITDMGFYLGIGGVVTFKNGGLDKVVPALDKERIVLETDSPYLAPAPNRGKRNEPAYLKLVAEKMAEIWEVDLNSVDEITTVNAKRLFKLT